jgi:O-acetyl-ADP-ribose deacetylase (regulator of RNase III)
MDKKEKNIENVKIILGDITYPKSEAVIIPANLSGLMNKGVPSRIVKVGWQKVEKEAKKALNEKKMVIGDCFVTDSGRLKRRGVKKIYHTIIKRYQNDFTSVYIVQKALSNVMKKVIKDKNKTVALCGIGIEPGDLDKKSIAKITMQICDKFSHKIKIKIIDDNKEFIDELNKIEK